jgi:P-type Cu+ transporter
MAEIWVRGMTCASCAVRVEKKLNAIELVVATVNIATEKASVYAPGVPVERLVAASAVAELRELGLSTVLLSGDAVAVTRAVAEATGIGEVVAEALPDAKIAFITGLRAKGRSVAMVGDGVNDGPALAAADLGLALGTGTDVAMSAADMILMRDDLGAVPEAIRLARATMRTIRQNLGWAFGYNLAAIPVAAAGFCNPLIAAAAMAFSSACDAVMDDMTEQVT